MALVARRPARGIQTALFQRLSGDSALAGLGAQVRDHVDEQLPHPYVSIGEISTEAPNNAHDMLGRDTTIYVHAWSTQRSWDEANDIADRIVQLVDHQPMTVPGHRVVAVRFEFGQNVPDEDDRIRHVAMRFRITTETEQEA
ncbi:DUF3168 domain-containing protein [Nocardiopsis suaedae]|uniref:DUF3168 domain-containing protein n=1 Tax=Nocardiopsis suaedae TaxID=3018444 RepID=A0ABT4TLY4_9ACTN|nr:DUF3168 domain-containing protein [Nocardiopsis suaedae]MDA2805703.1 DUF3168 domain-containing protein [Nocardiopsis suaedae]